MPRNSSGTYSLPAGNPVVTGTVINSSWANNTLSDLATAMTDSLSRSGDGGMLTALELANGLIGAPGLSFGSETNSGLYRAGAGDHRYSIAATAVMQITANGLRAADGAAATPAFSFISDTDIGMYRIGANVLGFAISGAELVRLSGNQILVAGATGLASSPDFSFTGDTNTGMYRI
jgi:hypothetical protein